MSEPCLSYWEEAEIAQGKKSEAKDAFICGIEQVNSHLGLESALYW